MVAAADRGRGRRADAEAVPDDLARVAAAASAAEEGRREVNDDARKAILARRAKFVAAAIAGMAVSCGKENATTKVDAGAHQRDAGVDASIARPHACLCVCEPGDPLCSCL